MALDQDPIVSTDWLAQRLGRGDVCPLDATWWFPFEKRDAKAEFEAARIPGAVFFDVDAIADLQSALPHMLPTPEAFAKAVGALGIGDGDTIVVYEADAPRSAARAWWSFRVMGANDVRVLDGGLRKWRAEGRVLASGTPAPEPAVFTPRFDPRLVRTAEEMARLIGSAEAQIVDARPAARFQGTAPEPRPGLRPGHMPGARSLPAPDLYDADGAMLEPSKLRALFKVAGVDPDRPVAATCGSGITACNIALALARLGRPDTSVYDGSWAEWGALLDAPVALGPADTPSYEA